MDPDTIREQRFLLVRRGYDPEAVQSFLEDVARAVEELQSRLDDPDGGPGTGVVEARRLVDQARTRAATHRLRAQRDVEALERTARQRRARLLGEIEELAAARDQLSTDLDRAVDVVDRVVQWVRRTDPTAVADAPGAVRGATPSVTATEPSDEVGEAPDDVDAEPEVVAEPEDADHLEEAELGEDVAEPEYEDEPDPEAEAAEPDGVATEDQGEAQPGAEDEAELSEEPLPDDLVAALDAGPDVVTLSEDPAVVAVREALRSVQDEVLAQLRDQPRGDVEDWLPSRPVLDALDDAATDAAYDAFLEGWQAAAADGDEATEAEAGPGRDALEEVVGSGDLPDLAVGGDLRMTLEASLARGRDAGEVEVALRERVAEVHRDLRQTRLPDAIEQVLVAARHHGELARWRHDGIEAIAWVVGQEQRCPGRRCRGNATDGVVAPGDAFAFGDVVPPAHPGCTCTLRPVGPDEHEA